MVCFLDTNVFLECNSIFEIDWSLLTNDTEISIYICFTVLDELDKFKTDQNNRRKKRASNSIKLLLQIFEQNFVISHRQQRFHLDVKMANNYTDEELKGLHGLDISRNDDMIIATIALFNKSTNNNAILISHDLGIRLKGKQFFVCNDVPSEWLLSEEKDENQKEIEKLRAELLQAQKKEPQIECNLFINSVLLKNDIKEHITLTLYDDLSNEQINNYMYRIESHCPRTLDYSIPYYEKQMKALSGYQYVAPSQSKIDDYNKNYSEWLRHQKYVLETFSKKHNKTLLIFPIRIELDNIGNVPAESFEIEFFSNSCIFFETNNLKAYKDEIIEHFHVAPEAPKGEFKTPAWLGGLDPDFSHEQIPLTFLRNYHQEYHHEENKDKFAFYPFYDNGKLKIQCDEMQHQKERYILESYFLIDEDKIKNNQVNFSYQIYAKNLAKTKTVTHTIELNIKRESAIDFVEKELKEKDCI